jgi:hypothetical protein
MACACLLGALHSYSGLITIGEFDASLFQRIPDGFQSARF